MDVPQPLRYLLEVRYGMTLDPHAGWVFLTRVAGGKCKRSREIIDPVQSLALEMAQQARGSWR